MYDNELYHWGIKGQKWGVRRFQNKDGSLTPAGKKRYDDDVERLKSSVDVAKKNAESAYKKYSVALNRYCASPTKSNYDNLTKANKRYESAINDRNKAQLSYKAAKMDADGKLMADEDKSKHRRMLEEKYQRRGYDEKQAAVLANDHIKAEKVVAAAAALTITACAAYATNKYIKDRTDGMIKSGELLQRIEMTDTGGKLHDMFYISKGEHDNKRYAGLLGMNRHSQTGHAYVMKLQANTDIKVASKEKAAQVFGELYKNDPDFNRSVKDIVGQHFGGTNKVNVNNISDRNIRKMYENFNSAIMDIRDSGSGADKKFYDKLKQAGYGAIQDINDMKYSGYNAKNPLIVFDNSNNNIMVKSITEMTNHRSIIDRGVEEYKKSLKEIKTEKVLSSKHPALMAGGALTGMLVGDYASIAKDSRIIKQYKKDHPNTKLTDREILKNYSKEG